MTQGTSRSAVKSFRSWAFVIVSLAGLIFFQIRGFCDEAEVLTHQIASEVLSPFCPGRTLNDCPSGAATDLKKSIASDLRAGKTEDEVLTELYAVYGDDIRIVPSWNGFGIVAWIMPFLFATVGALVLVFWVQSRRKWLRQREVVADGSVVSDSVVSDSDTKSQARTRHETQIRQLIDEG